MEDETKERWLNKLKPTNNDWEDGDLDNQNKTADLVNGELKLVIELKNDTAFKFKPEMNGSLITLFNRYKRYARDANHKFSFYSDYKTILLIECEIYQGLLQRFFTGTQKINMNTGKSFWENKNLWEGYPNIGCYLISSNIDGVEFYYFKNPVANKERIIEKEEVDKYLDISSSYL